MGTKTKRGVLELYGRSPAEVRRYFEHLPQLLEQFPVSVALSYVFGRVELAQHMALYCGIVKIHKGYPEMARKAVDGHYMTRQEFRAKFEAIYGKPISASVATLISSAEDTRDKVMHGKQVADQSIRSALADVLAYAAQMNTLTKRLGGPAVFGDLRGFKGRGKSLDRATTRWMLKGMGFAIG